MGRRRVYNGPHVTTTVRVPAAEWEWVKRQKGAQFSAILVGAIRRLIKEAEEREAILYIQEKRRALGLPIVGPITKEVPP